MLVNDFLQDSAERFPDKVALICDSRRLSYAQIEEQANQVANGLLDLGVQRGDRVAVWLPNSVETVIAIFGILKAGATFTVVNATTKPGKLAYVLNNCAACGLFAPARQRRQVEDLFDAVPSTHFAILCGKGAVELSTQNPLSPEGEGRGKGKAPSPGRIPLSPGGEGRGEGEALPPDRRVAGFPQLLETYPPTRPPCPTIDIDLACLIYTSGSTGEPKGVMSTHANMVFAASSIIQYLENVPEDIVINVLPLSFDYGLYQLMMVFKFGGTLVLERSFTYPAAILRRVAEEKVTGLPGVPTIFAILLEMDLSQFDLSSLRYLTNTAAALPVEHIRRLRDAFPWARLYSMYGLTECKRTLYLPPEELDRRPGSVGIAIPGTEVWIEDESGARLGPGEVGELVIRGSHVMQGYWNAPEKTAQRYRPGRYPAERKLYSGDLFKMDEEGFLYFVARKDDIIKSRGEKVAPKEVESAIYQLPGVVEVAVVGVPDEILGQAIKAFVVCGATADGHQLTEKDVIRHCTQHLENFMVPSHVEFRDSLPKTSSGKIRAATLRES